LIKIKSVEKTNGGLLVEWTSSFKDIKSLSIVFDDNGSCTNIGLDANDTSFFTTGLPMYRGYEIHLKALTSEGWKTSDDYSYRLD
jgi:hypothetical protein